MTNEPDSISPTPVYGFEKVQINNIGWMNTIARILNADLDTIETAIQSGGGTTNYNALSNRPQINAQTLTGNLTAAQLSLLGVSDTQTISNKTINADNNTISNIAGDNFKTQSTSEAGKVWGIGTDGSTVLTSASGGEIFKHSVMLKCENVKITCDIISAIQAQFNFGTLCAYLENAGYTSNEAVQPAIGFGIQASNGAQVFGISSPDGMTLNAYAILNGSETELTNLTPTSFVDITLKVSDH